MAGLTWHRPLNDGDILAGLDKVVLKLVYISVRFVRASKGEWTTYRSLAYLSPSALIGHRMIPQDCLEDPVHDSWPRDNDRNRLSEKDGRPKRPSTGEANPWRIEIP